MGTWQSPHLIWGPLSSLRTSWACCSSFFTVATVFNWPFKQAGRQKNEKKEHAERPTSPLGRGCWAEEASEQAATTVMVRRKCTNSAGGGHTDSILHAHTKKPHPELTLVNIPQWAINPCISFMSQLLSDWWLLVLINHCFSAVSKLQAELQLACYTALPTPYNFILLSISYINGYGIDAHGYAKSNFLW